MCSSRFHEARAMGRLDRFVRQSRVRVRISSGLVAASCLPSSLVKATDEHVEPLDRYRHGDGLAARQREVGDAFGRVEVVAFA